MCHKLLQVHCCGHTKEVCTTPCTHALATATPAPKYSPELPGHTRDTPPLRHHPSVGSIASLPIAGAATSKSQDRDTLPSQATHAVRTNSLSNLTTTTTPPRGSLTFAPSHLRHSTVSLPPPPYTQSAAQNSQASSQAPTVPPLPLDPNLDTPEMMPNLCAQFFAHYLLAGNHPCYDCYMRPEYEPLRRKWMRMYAEGHPGVKLKELEKWTGIQEMAKRMGLVNVAREVNTAESGKVAGAEAEKEE